MVSLVEQDKFSKALSFMGLSTDEKPTDAFSFGPSEVPVVNGSAFYEIDTGDLFIFDEDEQGWVKQIMSGGGGGGYPEPTGTVTIITNGTKNVKNYAQAVVNVPQGVFPEGTLNIAANGSYNVSDKASVEVDVPNPSTGTINITSNGTYDVSEKASAEVAVPDTAKSLIEGTVIGVYENPSIERIKPYAFYNCNFLTKAVLDGAVKVGNNAFQKCSISEASFATAKEVASQAFMGESGLLKVNIPLVETVGMEAFAECFALNQVIANNLKVLEENAFLACSDLANIDLSKVTNLGTRALCRTGVVKATLPLLESLGTYVFHNDSSLISVDIGSNFSGQINSYAFGNTALASLVLRPSTVVPLAARNALTGTPIEKGSGYVYVPDSLAESYKTATNWVYFANQIKPLSELPS